MTRWLVGLVAVAAGGAAQAQVYGAPGASGGGFGTAGYGMGGYGPTMGNLSGAFAPNFYNRTQQPLSPYLNLNRGGNPAVNYFYGVRPGLSPTASGLGGGFGPSAGAFGPPGFGNRFYLQPPAGEGELPYQPFEAAQDRVPPVIPTAAHPVVFGNGPGLRGPARGGFGAQQPAQAGRPATTAPRR